MGGICSQGVRLEVRDRNSSGQSWHGVNGGQIGWMDCVGANMQAGMAGVR